MVRLCGRARPRVEVGHHGALELAERVRDKRGVAARLGAAEPRLLLLGELVLSDLELHGEDDAAVGASAAIECAVVHVVTRLDAQDDLDGECDDRQ